MAILPAKLGPDDPGQLQAEARIKLRILATSDMHASILPWDDITDKPAPGRGLGQLASLIAEARAEQPQALLFDNGDFLHGSPLGDYVATMRPITNTRLHPMIAAMNLLRYDAATLGNHEFSYGLTVLQNALAGARFPVVSANLFRTIGQRLRSFVPRFQLLRRSLVDEEGQVRHLAIGVIGFLPPQTVEWEHHHLAGKFQADDILKTARACLPRLRRAGADVIIGLSHSGIGTLKETPGAENATRALASMWGFGSGFDALIGGHTHQLYPIPAGDTLSGQAMIAGDSGLTPLVMPGFFGSHLGVIDLELCHDGQRWRVGQHRTELRPVAQRSPDGGCLVSLVATAPQIAEIARPDHAAMVGLLAKPVGRSLVPLHSYFALIGETPIQQLLGAAQKDHIGRLLQDTPFAGLPLISAVAPFKAGGRGGPDNFTDLPAGELTERSISDLYIHPNTAVALCLTGADLMQWLERAVSLFHQIAPGTQDAPLIDPAFPAFNFDIFQGVSFQIDLTQPARFDAQGVEIRADAQRIRAVRLNGLPLAKDARVVVATNSYRASGGAGFAGADCRHVILESGQPIRQVLQSYIRENKFVRPAHTADWHFKPCPRTSVTFDSAPEAARHMLNPALAVIGLQTSGFMRFRLLL